MGRRPLKIMLVAGEPSADLLGARLMTGLRDRAGEGISFIGVGGAHMTAAGLTSLFPMEELSVMGLFEVLPKVPRLLRRIRECAELAMRERPDVVVTIDAPDFNFRLAARLKGKGISLVHYVAPTVWAWRPGRAAKIARLYDHLLTILPFEPFYFEKEGLGATFVGHSVVESGAGKGDGVAFRARHGIAAEAKLLMVLPGSRHGELRRHLPIFQETVSLLCKRVEGMRLVVPTLPHIRGAIEEALAAWPGEPVIVTGEDEKFDAMAAAAAALAASGTVALELALAGLPSVIAYKVNAATAWLARRLIRVKYVSLVNILLDRPVVPEFLQADCRADLLAPAVEAVMMDGKQRARQLEAAEQAAKALGRDGPAPSLRAADAVLELLGREAATEAEEQG